MKYSGGGGNWFMKKPETKNLVTLSFKYEKPYIESAKTFSVVLWSSRALNVNNIYYFQSIFLNIFDFHIFLIRYRTLVVVLRILSKNY